MKRIFTIVLLLIITAQNSFAFDRISFFDIKKQSEYNNVKALLNSQVKYANKGNLDKLLATYDDQYVSEDGLNKESYSKLVEGIWETYPNLKYGIKIKDIDINGDSAIAHLTETSEAYIPMSLKISGQLKSESESEYKLNKINGKWKVISDSIQKETTSMLYGEAKTLNINLYAPAEVVQNEEYTTSLEFIPPKNTMAIASIAKETIEFPQKSPKEVFRKLPEDYILERLFVANNDKKNEFVIATIALAKASILNHNIKFDLSGFGYHIVRVNVKNNKENKDLTINTNEKEQ